MKESHVENLQINLKLTNDIKNASWADVIIKTPGMVS